MITTKKAVNAVITSTQQQNWESIPWDLCMMMVKKLQVRIAKATKEKKWRKVKSLQWLLTHSFSARAIAVKKVVENKGGKTPGIDGLVVKTPHQKTFLILDLKRRGYRAKPLRRIYIPKANGKSKRPLGIPTIKDRAMQAVYALALTPVAETTADPCSYGFRPERSCADAMEHCFKVLSKKISLEWILEGDIKGCFDNINHAWLLKNIPIDKSILAQWLQSGYIESKKLFPTGSGTPQGGIISPILSNMTLDGLARRLKEKFGNRPIGINLVRYADDFIVSATTKECLEGAIKPLIIEFLAERGLQLSLEKIRTTHISEGFDFLGQNVRKYKCGRYRQKLLIKPSKDNIKTFLRKIRQTVRKYRGIDQVSLIKIINPKVRGWANYHRSVVSKAIFSKIDHEIWKVIWGWSKWRHPKKSAKWIINRYFQNKGLRNYCFSGLEKQLDGIKKRYWLIHMSDVAIQRHVKIRQNANPFDKEQDSYFEQRNTDKMKQNKSGQRSVDSVIALQNGKCPLCKKSLKIFQNWRIRLRRSFSNGGNFTYSNMIIVHNICNRKMNSK